MRAIGPADSAQKRGKSAKICEFSGKFIHSFSRNLVLALKERQNLYLGAFPTRNRNPVCFRRFTSGYFINVVPRQMLPRKVSY
jgi:hypothetical protein